MFTVIINELFILLMKNRSDKKKQTKYSHCFNSEMKVRMIFMHGIDPYADVNQTKMVLF